MKKVLTYLKRVLFYGGYEKRQYDTIKSDLISGNHRIWKSVLVAFTMIFLILFLRSFISNVKAGQVGISDYLYGLMTIVFGIISAILLFVIKKPSIASQIVIYISIALLYITAVWLNTDRPNDVSVVFIVMLAAIPLISFNGSIWTMLTSAVAIGLYVLICANYKNDNIFGQDIQASIIYGMAGIVGNYFIVRFKIRDLLHVKRAIRQRDIDDLTGLYNKAALMKYINLNLCQGGKESIMVVLDVDHFKLINDNYGHSYGDLVLAKLGAFLKTNYSEKYFIGRFGGDEFIIFMNNINDLQAAKDMASSILEFVNENVKTPNRNENVGICAGIALSEPHDKQYDDLFKKADIALYKAKENGRNQYQIYVKE